MDKKQTAISQKNTEWPININTKRYYSGAIHLVRTFERIIPIDCAILDDWNTGNVSRLPRIIFGNQLTMTCQNDCTNCPMYQTLGEDDPNIVEHLGVRASLCRATDEQLAIFPSKQRYLNCKTFEQYLGAFIAYFVNCCHSREEIVAELLWLKNFRLLRHNGSDDQDYLKIVANQARKFVLRRVIEQMDQVKGEKEKREGDRRSTTISEFANMIVLGR